MCPMCEDRGWPLGQTAIETRYRELVKHKPTVCAVVRRMMKHLIHNSSWSSSQPHVDIPKAKMIAQTQFSKSRSVQAACQCAQARERGRSARGSLSMPTSGELDRSGQPLQQRRRPRTPAEYFVGEHHHRAPRRQSFESQLGSHGVETDVHLKQRRRRMRRRSSSNSRTRTRRRSSSSSSSSPLSRELHSRRRPASEPHPSARLSGRRSIRVAAVTSTMQTIDTTCEACGAEVHIPCLTKTKKKKQLEQRDQEEEEENLSSSSSASRSTHWRNPPAVFFNAAATEGPNNNVVDNLSTLSLDSLEFRTTSISKRSSASFNRLRGSLRSMVSISETVFSTSSELYEDASMTRSLSRRTLSSLRDLWSAHNEFLGCSSCSRRQQQRFEELLDHHHPVVVAKKSLARGGGLGDDDDDDDDGSDLDEEPETSGRFYSSESDTMMYSLAAEEEEMGQELSISDEAPEQEEDLLLRQLLFSQESSAAPQLSQQQQLQLSHHKEEEEESAEWVTEYDGTDDKLRDSTKKSCSSGNSRSSLSLSSSSASSSSSTPKSTTNLSSGFPGTGKKKDNTTRKTTASFKQKSPKSVSIVATSNYHPNNNNNSNKKLSSSSEKHRQQNHSPTSPSVVVLLGKYGNRKGMRIAGLQQSDPQASNHHRGGSQMMMMMQRHHSSSNNTATAATAAAADTSGSSSDHSHEWACAKRAIASFQDEVARMLLEGTGDVSELEDIEDFLNGYMRLNTPFYLEMVEEFFRAICLDCFNKPSLATGSSSKHTSNNEPQQQPATAATTITTTTTTTRSDQRGHHLSSSPVAAGDASLKSKWRSALRIR